MPVGQVFLLHCRAWMQPSANMKPRAVLMKSAPTHSAQATSAGVTSLPEAITRTRSRRPYSSSLSTSSGRLSRSGKPMSSMSGCGAAPVPPSALSTVMKSGALSAPRFSTSANSSSSHDPSLTTALKPTGLPVTSRMRAIMSRRDAADARNLLRHLGARQDAALAGLRALAQLDFNHAHLRMPRHFAQLALVEIAVKIAHAVLGGAHLEHQVAAAGEVVWRQAALAGVEPDPRHARAVGERQDGGLGDGAVAHGGDVEKRPGDIRRAAITNRHGLGLDRVGVQRRKRAVDEDDGAGGAQIAGRAEGHRGVDVLRRAIGPGTLGAVERQLLAIHGEEILAEEIAEILEEVAEPADDRIIAADGVLRLADVQHVHDADADETGDEDQQQQRDDDFQGRQQKAIKAVEHVRLTSAPSVVPVLRQAQD